MRTVKTPDGLELACHEAGRSDGRPALLVHGLTANASVWADTHPALAPRFRVVMPDLRGHGASGRTESPGDFTLEHVAADVQVVADAYGFEVFTLIGHGLGGTIAQLAALDAPDRIEALVLIGTGSAPLNPESGWAATRRRIADVMERHGPEAAWDAYLESGIFGWDLNEVPEEIVGRWRADFLKTAPSAFVGLVRSASSHPDLASNLTALSCPVLIITGTDDDAFGDDARRLAGTLDSAELCEIPGGGHSPHLVKADEFNEAVLDFLRRALPRARR